jgi:hypothetical protein
MLLGPFLPDHLGQRGLKYTEHRPVGRHYLGVTRTTMSTAVHTTEYTELQPLLSGVHSVMRVIFALAGEGGGCPPTPSHYIYHQPVKLQCTLQLSGQTH